MKEQIFRLLRQFTIHAYNVRGVGLGRLCEVIRSASAGVASDQPLLVNDFYGHCKFLCHLKEHMGSQIFFRGAYSHETLALLSKILPQNGVFLDIGANQGELTVAAAMTAPYGKVVAVEPVTASRERLLTNVQLNDLSNVLIVPVAFGEQPGVMEIFTQTALFADGTSHGGGLATLYPTDKRNQPVATVQVAVLDDLWPTWGLDRLDVLKIDVEGAEWPALRGAQTLLARYRPTLIVEIGRETCHAAGYEPEAFAAWLIDQHYRLFELGDRGEKLPMQPRALKEFQNVLAVPQI